MCGVNSGGNPGRFLWLSDRKRNLILKKVDIEKECCPNILFALPESVLDKSKARFRRLQNSPAAQTLAIADLEFRQDLIAKTLSTAAQSDIWVLMST
jgi:hypothetical protein